MHVGANAVELHNQSAAACQSAAYFSRCRRNSCGNGRFASSLGLASAGASPPRAFVSGPEFQNSPTGRGSRLWCREWTKRSNIRDWFGLRTRSILTESFCLVGFLGIATTKIARTFRMQTMDLLSDRRRTVLARIKSDRCRRVRLARILSPDGERLDHRSFRSAEVRFARRVSWSFL